MSVKILSLVLENGPTDALEKLVMVVIADHADDSGGHAFPGIALIARKSCQSPRNAMRVIGSLEVGGWLTVNRKAHHGKGNSYQLNIARLRTGVVTGDTVSPMARKKAANKEASVVSGDTVSPMLKTSVSAVSGDKSGASQVTTATESGDKNAIPFNSINRPEPSLEPKANTPLPPSGARGERVSSSPAKDSEQSELTFAVFKVARELNITERRMGAVFKRVIESYRAKTDTPPSCNEVAERMIRSRGEYLKLDEALKYQVNVRKFFERGIWLDERQWVLDPKEVERMRMASRARVGSY